MKNDRSHQPLWFPQAPGAASGGWARRTAGVRAFALAVRAESAPRCGVLRRVAP